MERPASAGLSFVVDQMRPSAPRTIHARGNFDVIEFPAGVAPDVVAALPRHRSCLDAYSTCRTRPVYQC
jgi:hypothetical protein